MHKKLNILEHMSNSMISVLFCLFLLLFSAGCRIEKENVTGLAQFSLTTAATTRAYTEEDVLDMAAGIIVTIVDSDNNPVYTDELLNIFTIRGEKFPITPPITLCVGEYSLTRFDIVDEASNIIFSTPQEGSPLAGFLADPLPIAFEVQKDIVTKVVPEVLATEFCDPQDFGYTTFSFTIVNIFDFYIAFFTYNEVANEFDLTEADLRILGDGTEIFNMSDLPAVTNRIFISEDYATYTLIVDKAGYEQRSADYALAELNLDCDDKCPVTVVLIPQEFTPTPIPPTPTPTPTPVTPTPSPTPVPLACGPYILPESPTVGLEDFIVVVMANTQIQELSAYDITLDYDPTILQFNSVTNSTMATSVGVALVSNASADSVQISGFTAGSFPAGENVELCILSFTAISTGTSGITFSAINAMTDTNFTDICAPFTGTDGVIIVQ